MQKRTQTLGQYLMARIHDDTPLGELVRHIRRDQLTFRALHGRSYPLTARTVRKRMDVARADARTRAAFDAARAEWRKLAGRE